MTVVRRSEAVGKRAIQTRCASVEYDTKRVQSALCTRLRIVFSLIRLGPKTSVYEEKYVTVQQHSTCSTCTPPRVARLCQIRERPTLH